MSLTLTESDLLNTLLSSESPARRAEAVSSMMRLPSLSDPSIEVIMASLANENSKIRVATAKVCGKFRVVGATNALRALLADSEATVRLSALSALYKLPSVHSYREAREMLGDSDSSVVRQAVYTLTDAKQLNPEDVVPLLEAKKVEIRRSVAYALGKTSTASANQLLQKALKDPDRYVRLYAVQFLKRQRIKESVTALLISLKLEDDELILSNIIKALEALGNQSAVPALIDATQHSDAFIRHDAARALGELGDRRAIPALQVLLNDTTKPARYDKNGLLRVTSTYCVCDQAKRALQKIKGNP